MIRDSKIVKRIKKLPITTRNSILISVFGIASVIIGILVTSYLAFPPLQDQITQMEIQNENMRKDLVLYEENIRLLNQSLYKQPRMSVSLISNKLFEAAITISLDDEGNIITVPQAPSQEEVVFGFLGYVQNFTYVIKNIGSESLYLNQLQIHIYNGTFIETYPIIKEMTLHPDDTQVGTISISFFKLSTGDYKLKALALADTTVASHILDLIIENFHE